MIIKKNAIAIVTGSVGVPSARHENTGVFYDLKYHEFATVCGSMCECRRELHANMAINFYSLLSSRQSKLTNSVEECYTYCCVANKSQFTEWKVEVEVEAKSTGWQMCTTRYQPPALERLNQTMASVKQGLLHDHLGGAMSFDKTGYFRVVFDLQCGQYI